VDQAGVGQTDPTSDKAEVGCLSPAKPTFPLFLLYLQECIKETIMAKGLDKQKNEKKKGKSLKEKRAEKKDKKKK